MSDCIEKLKECADKIEREHEEELQELKESYNVDLREAREARDIAIKEAAEYNNQLGNIIEYLGASIRKKPVMSSQDRYYRIITCLYRRLMPPGMEWPRFDDGMQIMWYDAPEDIAAVCLALDGSCYSLHYDMPGDERMCLYEVSERVKRPVTEMIGADVVPIEVSNTQPDTQERINDDATMHPHEYCKKHGIQAGTPDTTPFVLSDFVEPMALDLLRRQRELDARTMGGE